MESGGEKKVPKLTKAEGDGKMVKVLEEAEEEEERQKREEEFLHKLATNTTKKRGNIFTHLL